MIQLRTALTATVCLSVVFCLSGCREAQQATPAKSDGHPAAAHAHADAHTGHDHAPTRPSDLSSGVAALDQHYRAIREAFMRHDTDDAHGPLHAVGGVLEALPELAQAAELPADIAEKLQASVDIMFAAYGSIDEALHHGQPADYEAVACQLCEQMAAIRALAGSPPAAPQTDRPLRLAFVTCCQHAPFFEPVRKGMQDAAAKMGVDCAWMGIDGVDMQAQAEVVRQAIRDRYDGIALNLVDPEAFDAVVDEAVQAGIPVVGFNTDDHATPNARLSGVSQRLYEAGRALATHVAADIPDGAHVLMTMHDEGVSSLQDRLRGLQDVLQEKNVRWTVCISGNDSAAGAEIIAAELRKEPDIRIVLSTGQADTEAAGRAIEAAFAGQGYWAAGFDLSPTTLRLIKAQHIRCTVDQQPYIQGFLPVIQLTLYLRYGIVPGSMDSGAAIITAEEVDRVLELTEQKYR